MDNEHLQIPELVYEIKDKIKNLGGKIFLRTSLGNTYADGYCQAIDDAVNTIMQMTKRPIK